MIIDKGLVRRRFSSAVSHYDREATPQRKVTERLALLLADTPPPPEGEVLEIGCGTGLFSAKLAEMYGKYHPLVFNDLCPDMEAPLREKIGGRHRFYAADAETERWESGYSLIAAASCIQWWQEPYTFFDKAYDALRPGGLLAFGTYGEQNLSELRRVTGMGLRYDTADQIRSRLDAVGFGEIQIEEEVYELTFPNLVSLLRHLKLTGVNAIDTTTRWTPRLLAESEERYRSLFGRPDGAIPLSYHAVIGTARKPSAR